MHAYGSAGRGEARATVADHVRIGSITKTFTATVILQLVAQGKLSLSGTVARYDPALAAHFPPLTALTVRQLLSMRSGLPGCCSENGVQGVAAAGGGVACS